MQYCFELCSQDATNTHFGTQFSSECFCVNDPDRESIDKFINEPANCDMTCSGDSDEICGGFNAMSVYEIVARLVDATCADLIGVCMVLFLCAVTLGIGDAFPWQSSRAR